MKVVINVNGEVVIVVKLFVFIGSIWLSFASLLGRLFVSETKHRLTRRRIDRLTDGLTGRLMDRLTDWQIVCVCMRPACFIARIVHAIMHARIVMHACSNTCIHARICACMCECIRFTVCCVCTWVWVDERGGVSAAGR